MDHHQLLKVALRNIRYPKGVIAAPGEYCAIKGDSFFPGGKGHRGETLPMGGVMYLGHNFDKLQGFLASVNRGCEENLTWRRVRDSVLPHLSAECIWFTNYFMGVLERESNIGAIERSSGFEEYESDCWDFFKLQVCLQKPRLILALGKEVARVLCPPNRLNIPSWELAPNANYGTLRFKVHSIEVMKEELYRTLVVAAYHPSFGRSVSQIASIVQDSKYAASLIRACDQPTAREEIS